EGGQREVEEHDEGDLVGEEVVVDVRRRLVAGQDLVERQYRAQVEVRLPAEIARDLAHVAADGLEDELHPVEERVQRLGIAGEMRPYQLFERRGVAILGAPEAGRLFHAAAQAGT